MIEFIADTGTIIIGILVLIGFVVGIIGYFVDKKRHGHTWQGQKYGQ